MCTYLTFCWIRPLFSTTLIGPVAFGGRELCVLELHQSSVKELSVPAECNSSTHNSRPPNATGPVKEVLINCLVQQNVIQVHITPALQMPRDQSK
jgi:hypothetical protein